MLELKNIVKIYQGGTVNETCLFDGFSLSIPDRQFVCVVGSNGSGKTSLLNIICGSIPIDDGEILIGGENITRMPEHRRHRRIGRVYQDPARGTCPSMTILENMSMADNKGKPFNLMPCVNRKKTEEYRAMLAQLGLGQAGVYLQPWLIQAGDLNHLCHAGLLSAAGTIFRRGMVSPAIVAVWGGGIKLARSAITPPL